MKGALPWTAMASLCLASSSWAQLPPPVGGFVFQTIDPPGSTDTIARAINLNGDVVGQYLDAGGVSHGFLLRRGAFRRIDFPGASNSRATGINDRNEIVGVYTGGHGFLLREGRFTTLDLGGTSTSPRAINNAGDIVGSYSDAGGTVHGFLLRRRRFTRIDYPGAIQTIANSVNGGGDIVGDYQDGAGVYHSFLLSGGTFTPIDVPGADGEFGTVAYGLSTPGVIAGTCSSLTEGTAGFLLEGGQFWTLLFPGAYITRAFSINSAGWIVGDYFDASPNRHAFLATR
jgi:uncharacterized membrane protein